MSLSNISISGYRGFSTTQSMKFAIPNGSPGSGLTVITGSNNSGKSSILECLRSRNGYQNVSFTVGTRNAHLDYVKIEFTINGKKETVSSIIKGSSETNRVNIDDKFEIFVLPSRRAFDPYFGKSTRERSEYLRAYGLPPQRTSTLPEFSSRLFKINQNPKEFNSILGKVLSFEPSWTIDQSDQGQYFLKFFQGPYSHSSDGMGEGIVSIFAIVDAIYDSKAGEVIVIDEPELSLHPSLQKRLANLFLEYTKDRQIVISTHSPYFVLLEAIANGSHITRVINSSASGTGIFELSDRSKEGIRKLVQGNLNNPHVLGLDAREIFFQEDKLFLTEGQEDVVFYPSVASQLGLSLPGSFFGWGVGGATNMSTVAGILFDLGFRRVVGILDANKATDIPKLASDFPGYQFLSIPADDVRTKPGRKASESVEGLLDENLKIREKHKAGLLELFKSLNKYMDA